MDLWPKDCITRINNFMILWFLLILYEYFYCVMQSFVVTGIY